MNILDTIVAEKRREVARLLPQAGAVRQAIARRQDYRDFIGVLRSQAGVALIAEVKKASPSAGVIRPDFDPVRIATAYEQAGAAVLSVLTDEQFFQGKLEYLRLIRESVRLPLLRKDFIIDELQLYEAVAGGADAVLLIAAILDDVQLRAYRQLAAHLKLAALVEIHDEPELARAVAAGAELIGINNRNLKTFQVDLGATEKLAAQIPPGTLIVAESGIHTRADVDRVAAAGVQAILVGESLMRSPDIAGKVKELIG